MNDPITGHATLTKAAVYGSTDALYTIPIQNLFQDQ